MGNQQCHCELCNRSHFRVRDPYGTGCRAWRTPECICFFSVVLGETTKLLHGVHWGSDTRNNSRDCSPTVNKFVQNDIIKCVCVCTCTSFACILYVRTCGYTRDVYIFAFYKNQCLNGLRWYMLIINRIFCSFSCAVYLGIVSDKTGRLCSPLPGGSVALEELLFSSFHRSHLLKSI